ncbi:SDR family NAD(P)-dependent oxidoreductase [Marinimicrobium locisalis]|uniref:SDR family NAD(P)-dependent oxidoreductase n=1 Tax=Marinimicrobium locisalis TaxID=546022 RepID=UPI003221C0E1
MKPLAVVFGANSAIAQAMIAHVHTAYHVLAVSRHESMALPEGVEPVQCDYSESALQALTQRIQQRDEPLTFVFCAVGVLHREGSMPEKKLAELNSEQLTHYFAINSILPALILKHLIPIMPRSEPTKAVVLSAKIAGISDNRLGGWYGYRASKAALNMLIKTASIELARSHRKLCLVALHPGTTATPLSQPFTRSLPEDKLFTPALTSERLWSVIEGLGPEDTGRFLHWDGSDLPW